MKSLGDILREMFKTEPTSEKPVAYCRFCGKPLYELQRYKKVDGQWIPWLKPFVEYCDCEDAVRARREMEKKKLLEEERKNKIQRILINSGLPKGFGDKTFDNWDEKYNKDARDAIFNYAKLWPKMSEQGKGLYIYGPYGTGKTHLVVALANYIINEYSAHVVFGTLTKLFMPLKDAIGLDDTHLLQRERERLYNADLLIIDDLGKERPTDFVSEELYTLINTRYENKKPVVITSNYTVDEFAKKYDKWSKDYGFKDLGSAMKSRLFEMCYYIKMDGPDYRLLKR